MSKNVLVIGYGIDRNRTEAVSINTAKHIDLLKEFGYKVYVYNIGYENSNFNTGNSFISSLLRRKRILRNLIGFIKNNNISHVLDIFVLPLSSIIFTLPLKEYFPKTKFIKEIHNDYGFSRKFHSETVIRILANNRFMFYEVLNSFDKSFTNNLHLSKKFSIAYIPTEVFISNNKRVNDKKLNICYLGHPLQKKGISKFFDLIPLFDSQLKQKIKFNFAFSNVGPKEIVEEKLHKLGKQHNVNMQFFGTVKPFQFFRKNDIYILPIEDEYGAISTPNTILESMEAGCLVITNNIKSLKGITKNNKNMLLLKENTVKEVLFNILKVSNDIKLKKKIIKNARDFIKSNYDSKIIKEKVRILYV